MHLLPQAALHAEEKKLFHGGERRLDKARKHKRRGDTESGSMADKINKNDALTAIVVTMIAAIIIGFVLRSILG